MWNAHHFGSVRSCVSWYSAAGMTYLPPDTPCWGSILAGTATLLVSVPHGYHAACSYCTCDSWSISYSCFICGSYFTCDSCYAPCSCVPYPILIAWLCHPWSSSIPGHGLHAQYVRHVPGQGLHQDQPVEGSWLIYVVLHQVGRTVAWLLFGRNVGAGGPGPLQSQMAVASGPPSVPGHCLPPWPAWLGPVSLIGPVLCLSKIVLTAQS